MRLHGILASSVLVLGGCTTLDSPVVTPTMQPEVTISEIELEVLCELESLYSSGAPYPSYLDNWNALSTLTRASTDTLSGSPGVTVTPVSSPGLGIPASLTTSDQAAQTEVNAFNVRLGDIKPGTKGGTVVAGICSRPELVHSNGDVGVKTWLASTTKAAIDGGGVLTIAGGSKDIHFVVDRNLQGGFTFKNSIVDIDISKQSAKHEYDGELQIGLTPPDSGTAGGQKAGAHNAKPRTGGDITTQRDFLDTLNGTTLKLQGTPFTLVPSQ